MSRETIIEELKDGVLLATLNRPSKKNAFNNQQYDDFRDMLAGAQESDDVRVVVIAGANGDFSAGQDLNEIGAKTPRGSGPTGFYPFLDRVSAFDKPLFAAVEGVAIGIGTTLLLHCDLVYVAESARLRMPFTSLGLNAEAGSSLLLQQIVGPHRAAQLLYTSAWIGAADAVALGIAAASFPAENTLPALMEVAAQVAAQPPNAVRENKRLLLAARADALAAAARREKEVAARLMGAPENKEAVRAFLEKRPPDFSKL